jgi:hypothetical protein
VNARKGSVSALPQGALGVKIRRRAVLIKREKMTKATANGPTTAKSPTSAPTRPAPNPAGGLADLQRSVGNAAVTALLRQGSPEAPPAPGLMIQRDAVDDARKLLSYGAFDWAITDSEATKAFNLLKDFSGPRTAMMTRLGEKYASRLFDNLPRTLQVGADFVAILRAAPAKSMKAWLEDLPRGKSLKPAQKSTLATLFDATDNAEIALLKQIFEIRYDVKTGADTSEATGVEWDAQGLRASWATLSLLPPAQVEGNSKFKQYLRYDKGNGMGGGYYQGGGAKLVSMDYTSGAGSFTQANVSEAGDALAGVNRFNKVVRHEVGHAVDAKMGWGDGSEPAKEARGGWKQYGSKAPNAFKEMVTLSNAGISKLGEDARADVEYEMWWCAVNKAGGSLITRVKTHKWWDKLKAEEKTAVETDPVVAAMKQCLVGATPWYSAANGGTALGGRVFQESYADTWTSYLQSTRSRKVSQYQFRAPGEWFAEAYAAYYEPDDRGKGSKLADNDSASKTYFDDTVDKLK